MRISTASTNAPAKRRFNRLTLFFISASALCLLTIAGLLMWQYKLLHPQGYFVTPAKELQMSLASKVPFETVASNNQQVKDALGATDLDRSKSLLNQKGAFIGKVVDVLSTVGNSRVVIEFALARQTALRAVVKTANFSKFPNLGDLVGKKVLVSGVFTPHKERAEIELTEPNQLRIVG